MVTREPLDWSGLLGMGAAVAALLAVGLGFGWLVDWLTGAAPLFLFLGLLLGVGGAVSYTYVQFRRYLED